MEDKELLEAIGQMIAPIREDLTVVKEDLAVVKQRLDAIEHKSDVLMTGVREAVEKAFASERARIKLDNSEAVERLLRLEL